MSGVSDRSLSRPQQPELNYVAPFYLQMMRTNAVRQSPQLLAEIVETTRSAESSTVIALLAGSWRPQVMGAWLSVRFTDAAVTSALLRSLATSSGSLTSPPLAAAAVLVAGPGAMNALVQYYEADVAGQWGASGWIAAAAEHLEQNHGATNRLPTADPNARQTFEALLSIARQLRDQ
jgi:hypothetical protein